MNGKPQSYDCRQSPAPVQEWPVHDPGSQAEQWRGFTSATRALGLLRAVITWVEPDSDACRTRRLDRRARCRRRTLADLRSIELSLPRLPAMIASALVDPRLGGRPDGSADARFPSPWCTTGEK